MYKSTPHRRLLALGAAIALPATGILGAAPGAAQEPEEALAAFADTASYDWDLDGLPNSDETAHGTDPRSADTDGDRLTDQHELRGVGTMRQKYWGAGGHVPAHAVPTNPLARDTDGDGLSDNEENRNYTWPTRADSDGDGLDDGREVRELLGGNGHYRTNPLHHDTDVDGVGDAQEVAAGTDPNRPPIPIAPHTYTDMDGDGAGDFIEWSVFGTDPSKTDTDGDGAPDAVEIFGYGNADWGEYPASQTDGQSQDSDGDGLTDGYEFGIGTNANAADTDADGLTDAEEGYVMVFWHGTSVNVIIDPLDPDQNNNGVPDGQELSLDGLTIV